MAHKGDDLDSRRLKTYEEKGIDFLYLKREDFIVYVNCQLSLTRKHISHAEKPSSKHIRLVSNVLQDIYSKVFEDGIEKIKMWLYHSDGGILPYEDAQL